MIKKNLLALAPTSAKNFLKKICGMVPLPCRSGKLFRDYYNSLLESQWWSKQRLEEYQLNELSKLLHHAYENVPYYRNIFDERGLKPKDIQDFDALQKLPYLTKDIVNEHREDLTAKNFPKSQLEYATTGGSTAIPVGFYREKGRTKTIENAFVWRKRGWAGHKFGDLEVVLEANVSENDNESSLWRYNPLNNALYMSYGNMSDSHFSLYINKLRKFKPKFIYGHPSAVYILASYLTKYNINDIKLCAVGTSSETLNPFQRKLIEGIFKCKVFDHYSNSEMIAFASECEKHEGYHLSLEYCIMEILDKDGGPLREEGEIGEIIGTGLHNYAMPLIRYKTDDLAVHSRRECSCGRNLPLIDRIEGRLQELLVTNDNRFITMTSINMHDDLFDNVHQYQFFQKEKGKATLKIMKKESYRDRDTNRILISLKKIIGKDFIVEMNFTDHIPLTRSGKHRFLIQKLPIQLENLLSDHQRNTMDPNTH